ncbi:TPA: hypothetical protein ACTXXA_000481 [Legionella anisa]
MTTITLSESDIINRTTEELIALGNTKPLTPIKIVDANKKPSTDAKTQELQKHMGAWINGVYKQLKEIPFPDVLVNLILEKETGVNAVEIDTFAKANAPDERNRNAFFTSNATKKRKHEEEQKEQKNIKLATVR